MADEESAVKQEDVESLGRMHLKEEADDDDMDMDTIAVAESVKQERSAPTSGAVTGSATPTNIKRQSRSPVKANGMTQSPAVKFEQQETVGGDVTLKLEPGKPPKLARTTSHKVEKRPPALFSDYEDKTKEATSVFNILTECTYANKYLGTTESALECDCAEEWGKSPYHTKALYEERRKYLTNTVYRLCHTYQPCLRRRLRLHQPRHQNGVRG